MKRMWVIGCALALSGCGELVTAYDAAAPAQDASDQDAATDDLLEKSDADTNPALDLGGEDLSPEDLTADQAPDDLSPADLPTPDDAAAPDPDDLDAADAEDMLDLEAPDLTPDLAPDAPPDDPDDPWSGTPCAVQGVEGECRHTDRCEGDFEATPGLCPGPPEIQCCTPRQEPTPGGACEDGDTPTPNGVWAEEPYDDRCPPGMIWVTAALCIDRYEAHLVDIEDGEPRPWSPFRSPGDRAVRAASVEGAVPQGYINGVQAGRACAAASKRLCTNDEWLRACQGPQGRTYPYGNARQDGVCNDSRAQHPAVEYFGTSADWIFSELDHPCLNQLPDGLAPTGQHPGCATAEGAFDMMGNLHEWTSDPAGTFRGGFYVDTRRNGEGCLYRTTAHDVNHWDYSTGFRCCAAPR
jgi:sulfatase modifying factor 1